MSKLTYKEVKEAMKNGEVTLVNTDGGLVRVLAFTHKLNTLVTESEGGVVLLRREDEISDWTIKPNTKKYWLWAYKEKGKKLLRTTNEYYDDEYRDSSGFLSRELSSNDTYKKKLLYTEIEF